ncbi:MAG: hypothetical protein E6R14_03235 [Thermomicrobiales bacterium]|nr:MAG: hypothetical protein E6R14_03235 [Thermomicrobiales bacterium]
MNEDLSGLASFADKGLIVQPDGRGGFKANVAPIGYHSTEFSVGYAGSGAAELALATLAAYLPAPTPEELASRLALRGGDFERAAADLSLWADILGPQRIRVNRLAVALHQDFKWEFITPMPQSGGHVTLEEIEQWLEANKAQIHRSAR